jgi:hypothetical protein
VPLSTLAVPATSTGELIVLLASGLSMKTLLPSSGGVTAVVGSEELSGEAPPPADGEALAEPELAVGDPLDSTNVVVLSPPHPAIASAAMLTNTPTPNPFMTPLNALPVSPVTPALLRATE